MRKLITSISEKQLVKYIGNQLDNSFTDQIKIDDKNLKYCVKKGLERLELNFSRIKNKYYHKNNFSFFNHLNGDQYSAFLYFISNNAYNISDENLATKLYLLNKSLFGIDVFYRVKLPDHFLFTHPLGTILGNAKYDDFLVIYQNVTVGSTLDGIYPKFSKKTILYSNSVILGNCVVGENLILAANSSLINKNIPKNKIVTGLYPNNKILDNKNSLINFEFDLN